MHAHITCTLYTHTHKQTCHVYRRRRRSTLPQVLPLNRNVSISTALKIHSHPSGCQAKYCSETKRLPHTICKQLVVIGHLENDNGLPLYFILL